MELCKRGRYKIVDDISLTRQESLFNEFFYLLGSKSKNSYIKIPINLVKYCEDIIDKLDGNHSIEEIEDILSRKYGENIDVFMFVKKISQAGLIEGFEKEIDDEMSIFGLTLIKKDINLINNVFYVISNYVYFVFRHYKIVLCIIFFEIIYAFIYMILNKYTLIEILTNTDVITLSVGVTWLLTGLCFLLHEIGHAIAAIANGIKIKTFSFGLYLGLIPMFYFTYDDLKPASPKIKFRVTVAGIYTNLICAGLCLLLLELPFVSENAYKVLSLFLILNVYMIVGNLLPFKLCDGYYILSILLNKYDLRITLIKLLISFKGINDVSRRARKLVISYAIFSFVTFALSIYSFYIHIYNCFYLGNYMYGLFILTIFAITIIVTVVNIVLKSKGGKIR